MNKGNQIRMKVLFENIPIIDTNARIDDERDLDDLMDNVKLKIFGRKR